MTASVRWSKSQPEAQLSEQPRSQHTVALEMAQTLTSTRFAAFAPNNKLKQALELLQKSTPQTARDDPPTLISIPFGPRPLESDSDSRPGPGPRPEPEPEPEPEPQPASATPPLIRVVASADPHRHKNTQSACPPGVNPTAWHPASTVDTRDAKHTVAARRGRHQKKKAGRQRKPTCDGHDEQQVEKHADGKHQEDKLKSTRPKEPATAHTGTTGAPIVTPQQGSVVQQAPLGSSRADKNRGKRQRKKLQAATIKAQAATAALSGTSTSDMALQQWSQKQPDKETLKRQGELSHDLVPSVLRFQVPWLQSNHVLKYCCHA